ncbi:VanZ family protein [Planctomycetota bacterium]
MVREAGVSDKSLHFLSYLILVFLFWYSIKPEGKINWSKSTVWRVLFIVTVYGALDEIVQSFVGRTCDAMDITANLVGTLTGLLIFTFITFWPSALIMTAIVIFGITNIARTNLADVMPVINNVFNLCAYTVFAVLWIVNLNFLIDKKKQLYKWLISALIVPVGFLLAVKLYSVVLNRDIRVIEVMIPLLSITLVFSAFFLHTMYLKSSIKKK